MNDTSRWAARACAALAAPHALNRLANAALCLYGNFSADRAMPAVRLPESIARRLAALATRRAAPRPGWRAKPLPITSTTWRTTTWPKRARRNRKAMPLDEVERALAQ
jgi:hypothetical protein